jgi:hypothetical protein
MLQIVWHVSVGPSGALIDVQKGVGPQILAEPRRHVGVASDGLHGNHRIRSIKAGYSTVAGLQNLLFFYRLFISWRP